MSKKNMSKKNNVKKVKKEELKKTVLETSEKPVSQAPQMRQVWIETDGNKIRISRNETSGGLELMAVLQTLIGSLTSPK